jgi:hypothetical protein
MPKMDQHSLRLKQDSVYYGLSKKRWPWKAFSNGDFSDQKKNSWKLQGKSFFKIFTELYPEEMYSCSFGMMSESVHCSWNDSMDWCLQKNDDGTFSIFPFFHPADIRYITPLLLFCNEPYTLWLQRIGADDRYYAMFIDWIARQNMSLYEEFDRLYGDMKPDEQDRSANLDSLGG